MKYERLTEYGSNGKAFYADLKHDTIRVGAAIDRLAELEDKIEAGTLVEVPKGSVVLTPEESAEEMRLANEERKQAVKEFAEKLRDKEFSVNVGTEWFAVVKSRGIVELVKEVCGE